MAARAAVLLTLLGAPLLLARAASPAAGFGAIGATFAALFVGSGFVAFFATARSPTTVSPTHHGRLTLQIAPLLEQQTGFAAGGFVISLLLALAGVGTAAHPNSEIGGIVVCFTIAAGALYGLAFFSILGYRLDGNPIEPFTTEQK